MIFYCVFVEKRKAYLRELQKRVLCSRRCLVTAVDFCVLGFDRNEK